MQDDQEVPMVFLVGDDGDLVVARIGTGLIHEGVRTELLTALDLEVDVGQLVALDVRTLWTARELLATPG